RPKNYHGKVLEKITFRQAIEKSVNTATIRKAQEVGINKVAKIAKQFGVFDGMPEFMSYALGAGETTLLKLTAAYAMFGNGGKRISPTLVDYIQDKHGGVIFKIDERLVDENIGFDADLPPKLNDNRQQILSEQSVYQLTSLLEGVMQRGSGASANFLNIPIAGKTGTSNDSKDTWFIGYTPDIAVGIFVGFDDYSKSLGENANGANTALPIFIDFMKEVKKYFTPKPFRVPKGINLRKVDATTGEAPNENSQAIITEAFKEDEYIESSTIINEKSGIAGLLKQEKDDNQPDDDIKPVFGIY
ncbi:MAG: hypothetical protein LBS23_00480, partial [Holosporaceae bacterium]|nr:hypothetical protein [Holosporaceae bacterium]